MTPRVYAQGTSVSVEKTRAEIDTLLTRAGAVSVGILTDGEKNIATVGFTMKGARFRIDVPLPSMRDTRIPSRLDLADAIRRGLGSSEAPRMLGAGEPPC